MKPINMNFVRLGHRESPYKKLGVSEKGQLLNRAVRAGLPVPHGIIVLDAVWTRLQEWDALSVQDDDVHISNGHFFLESMALHKVVHPVVVRGAFSADYTQPTPAVLNIAPDDPDALIRALVDVWQAGAGAERRDIIVMEYVAPQATGHAVVLPDSSADSITVSDAVSDAVTDGQSSTTEPRQIDRLGRWQRPTGDAPYTRRLQQLLRGVRRSFGKSAALEIEWIDDGEVCWIVDMAHYADAPE